MGMVTGMGGGSEVVGGSGVVGAVGVVGDAVPDDGAKNVRL